MKHFGIVRNPRVSPQKAALAKRFRREPTEAERRAWSMLRGRRCMGLKFRRQVVIQGLMVDFYCAELRLAVELDGPVHDQQQGYDRARDEALANAEIRVIRIPNQDLSPEFLETAISEILDPVAGAG